MTACSYCLAVSIASAAIYSVLVDISLATSLTLADMNTGTGYMFLTLGWGNLIWQPLAQKFGKRVVYLSSLLGTMVSRSHLPIKHKDVSLTSLPSLFCTGYHDLGSTRDHQRRLDRE